jgi:hypothetical protein
VERSDIISRCSALDVLRQGVIRRRLVSFSIKLAAFGAPSPADTWNLKPKKCANHF